MEVVNENISARDFYEKSLAYQRQMVNLHIAKAMAGGNPVVKLPTQLYLKISEELKALGWEEDVVGHIMYEEESEGISSIFPVVCDGCSSFPEITDEQGLISAKTFYEATIKNQYKDIQKGMEHALVNGFSEVKLDYIVYPAVMDEMEKNDWQYSVWYANSKTKEECSMFYPICGFE